MYKLCRRKLMAIKPSRVPGLRKRRKNPADIWEKSVDALLKAGKYHRFQKYPGQIEFTSTEVRRFVKKDLPRLERGTQDELEKRYKSVGWAYVSSCGEKFYFSTTSQFVFASIGGH